MSSGERAVRCADCGLLTVRKNGLFVEVLHEQREHFFDSGYLPWCFAAMPEMLTEAMRDIPCDIAGQAIDGPHAEIVSRKRWCESFRQWRQGFTPKEHIEMGMLEEARLREDERDREMRMREDERDAHARRHNLIELVVVGVIVPIAMIGAQVATTMMQIHATVKEAVQQHVAEQSPKPSK